MSRIFKFPLHPDVQAFSGLVRILGVGWQGEELRLWAEYDDADWSSTSTIVVALTGESPPMDAEFIGTAVGPTYVAHVYSRRR